MCVHLLTQTWCRAWEAQRSETARLKAIAGKILGRWKHRLLSEAWVSWEFQHSELRRLRNITERVVARWINGTLAMAYEKWWHEVVRHRKAMRVTLLWSQRRSARAFRQWDAFVLQKAQTREGPSNPRMLIGKPAWPLV